MPSDGGVAPGAGAGAELTPISFEDLFRLRLPDSPALSFDGELLAHVELGWDESLDRLISEVVVQTAAGSPVWRSGGTGFDHLPRWATDAALLAFASEHGGQSQLSIVRCSRAPRDPGVDPEPPAPARVQRLCAVPGVVTGIDWAPGAGVLAVSSTQELEPEDERGWRASEGARRADGRRRASRPVRRVHLVATDGSSRRRLEVASDVWCARVAPDGSGLAFLSAGAAPAGGSGAVRLGIWLVDADLAAPAELLLEGVAGASSLCWSPDSRSIAFIGHSDVDGRRANRHVLLLDVESRRVRDLTPDLDRAAGIPVRSDDTRGTGDGALCWSSVTGRIYFELAEGGRGPIAWTTLDGASGRLFEGDEVCLSPALAAKAAWLAVVVTKSGDPGSVQLCDELAPSRRAVGCANRWLSERVVAPTQLVRTVSDDGVTLEGWLTVPRAPRCCGDPTELPPLSVSVHGGPHYAVGWRFSFEAQRLAGRGIAVLSPNPRGSLGYGSDFAELGDGWGGRDWHDVVGVLDAALELGTTDPQRVAIGGASYGGYLAQWAITQTDHFSAAISENGISDLFAQWGSGAERAGDPGDELGARPWDDPSVYVEHSPLRYADRMQTPLLLVHAELDANVPLDQSEQLQAALKLLGRESELVVLEGEGHLVNLLGRPSRRRLRAEVVDAHLDRYLVAESS